MQEKAIDYLDLIASNPAQVGHWLGFPDLNEVNNEWIRSFILNQEDQTLLAHRGSYKTTSLSVAITIMMAIYPMKSILFFRKTDTDVIEIINQVSKALKSPFFNLFTEVLYGSPIILKTDTASEIDTNLNSSARGSSQLVGLGLGTSITGKHADIVITDDIVNVKDRISKAERERTKTLYQELQNVKNRGGRFINTGTPWHKDDAISMMPNVQRFDCYSTGLMTKEEIAYIRERMTSSLFAANYELKHIADKDAMFTNPNYFGGNVERIYNGIGHIDAAYGGSDGTAFTIAKKQKDGAYVLFGKRWNKHVDDCLDEIKYYYDLLKCGTIEVESNADKGYLKKELRKKGMLARDYHESMNKYIKISTHLKKAWPDIYWLDDTDPDYINEILDYTENAEHDDSPDSAASLMRKLAKPNWLI